MKSALALTLLLGRCGTESATSVPHSTTHVQSAELESLVQEFALAYGTSVTVPVLVVPPQDLERHAARPGTIGLCVQDAHGAIVLLSSDYWAVADSAQRMTLVWHELGHCVLGLHHDATLTPDGGCPVSLMYPSVAWPAACMQRGTRTAVEYSQVLFGAQPRP